MANFLDFLKSKDETNGKTSFGSLVSNITNYIKTGQLSNAKSMGTSPAYTDSASENRYLGRSYSLKQIQSRFLQGNEWGTQSTNPVFAVGFDDPAHLTFKVEFGDWGYSTMDKSMIESVERNSIDSGVYYMDFDQFPMGLFKLTREEDFQRIKTYSAYSFLANRNEDRRAQYIADFVDGMHALQTDFPYIFQTVSGLEKLTDFDSARGQRLKDATITLQCIDEGIDLKIRTLMELYRKAAWDDEWQRWVLPDIYRYFKMIIYIFDDRALQMGNGQWSPDQDTFPCIALECGPCEFVIKSMNESSYTQNYMDVKNSAPTLEIKVKNIKTYFANQMFQRVKYINDIITKFDHDRKEDSGDLSSLTGSGELSWKYNWMARNFMMPDEYYAFATQSDADGMPFNHYVGNWAATTETGTSDEETFDLNMQAMYKEIFTPDNTWHRATVSDRAYVIGSWKDLWNSVKSIVTSNTTLVRDSRQPDRYYFTNDLVRMNPDTFTYYVNNNMSNMLKINMLNTRLDVLTYITQMRIRMMDGLFGVPKASERLTPNVLDTSAFLDSSIPTQQFAQLVVRKKKNYKVNKIKLVGGESSEQDFVTIEINDDIPEQEFTVITMNDDIPEQEFVELTKNLDKPEQDFVQLIKNIDKPIHDFVQLNMKVDKFKMAMTELIMNLDLPKQELAELIMNLDLPKMDLTELIKNIDIAIHEFIELDKKTDLPKQDFVQLLKNLDIPEMAFVLLNKNLDLPIQDFVEVIKNIDKPIQEFTELIKKYDLPEQELVEMIKTTDIPEQEMAQLITNLEKAQQDFVNIIVETDKAKQDFINLIINDEKSSHKFIELIKTVFIPKQILLKQLVNNYEPVTEPMVSVQEYVSLPDIEFTHLNDNVELPNQVMTEEMFNLSKPTQNFTELTKNEDKQEMVMTELVMNESKQEQTMTELVINEDKQTQIMTELVINESKQEQTMTELVINEDKQNQVMTELVMNEDKQNQQMTHLVDSEHNVTLQSVNIIDNDYTNTIKDVELKDNTSESVIKDVRLSEPSEVTDMSMTELVSTDRTVKMKDVKLSEPSEPADMSMTELVETDKDVSIKNVKLIETEESGDVPMTELVDSEYKMKMIDVQMEEASKSNDVPMTTLVDRSSNVKMNMTKQDTEDTKTSDMPMTEMIETDRQDSSLSTRSIYKDIADKVQTDQTLQGGGLIEYISDDLKSKIMRLVNIDTESIEKASFENMVKLVGIMEDTITEARRQLESAHLIEPEVKTKRNKLFADVKIQQAPRNSFLSTKMKQIDDAAMARAEFAQSQQSKDKK